MSLKLAAFASDPFVPMKTTFGRNGRIARTHKQAMRPSRPNVNLSIFTVPIVLARCPSYTEGSPDPFVPITTQPEADVFVLSFDIGLLS